MASLVTRYTVGPGKHNYPKHLEYKLRGRQGNCWFLLKEKKLAIASYKLAKDLLIAYPIEDLTKLEDISSKLNKFGIPIDSVGDIMIDDIKLIEQKILEERRVPPNLNKERHPEIPSISSAIKLTDIAGKGRGFVATENLKPGTF